MTEYAWLIHKDYISTPDEHNAKGTIGPRSVSEDQINALLAGEGRKFKMYDDDGELYYDGKIIGPEGEDTDFGPLWDFGMPNAGCTEIRYKNEETGEWEQL